MKLVEMNQDVLKKLGFGKSAAKISGFEEWIKFLSWVTKPRPHSWEFLRNTYGVLSTKRIWICVQCKISCSIVTTSTVINSEIKFLPKPHYILNKLHVLLWKRIPATWDLCHICAIKLNLLVPWPTLIWGCWCHT